MSKTKDFGDLIFHHQLAHCGVILFRLKRGNIDIHIRKSRLKLVLDTYFNQLHNFIVITEERIRVRKQEMQEAA